MSATTVTMCPVVHFEMPYRDRDRDRAARFYAQAFGWAYEKLGPEMGDYLLVTTVAPGARPGVPPEAPVGASNGGFYPFHADMPMQYPAVVVAVAAYHEELALAGVLLDGSGLKPSRTGWRIQYGAQGRRVVDGPFAEAKELVAGYTLIQVRSREEALEWSRRFPNPVGEGADAVVEVRELYELKDFAPGEALDRMKAIDASSKGARP